METKTYNGWTNYETWLVKLWMDNEEGDYRYWNSVAYDLGSQDSPEYIADADNRRYSLARRLEDEHTEHMPEVKGMWADLLRAALQEVDWNEIANALLEDRQ